MSQEEKEKEQEQNIAPETNEEPKVDSEHAKHERKRRHERHRDESAQKVQEMGEKLAEMNDKYVRLYSEYENYRKRTNMEKADLIMNGGKEMIKAVLPVVDDMERALQAMDDSEGAK